MSTPLRIRGDEGAKKCIGYLPEIPPLYVDMTVYEYLKFVAELKKLDRKKRKEMIADAMDMTGITEATDWRCSATSSRT